MAEKTPRTIFVAYPYRFSHADYRGAFKAVEEEFENVRFVYADEQITNKHILDKIRLLMSAASLSLFDITTWNANVSLELGIAIGSGLDYYILFNPTIEAESVPADLGGIDRIQYSDYAELREGTRKLMRQQFGSPEPEVETPPAARLVSQIEAIRAAVPALVEAEPGLQIGGIASSLDIPLDVAQLVVAPLLAEGELVTRGVSRGTRFYTPGNAPAEEATIESNLLLSRIRPNPNLRPLSPGEIETLLAITRAGQEPWSEEQREQLAEETLRRSIDNWSSGPVGDEEEGKGGQRG